MYANMKAIWIRVIQLINIPIALKFSDIANNIYTTGENAFKYSYYVYQGIKTGTESSVRKKV